MLDKVKVIEKMEAVLTGCKVKVKGDAIKAHTLFIKHQQLLELAKLAELIQANYSVGIKRSGKGLTVVVIELQPAVAQE